MSPPRHPAADPAADPYRLSRLNIAASPLYLRGAEVRRGLDLLMLGQAQLAAAADPLLKDKGLGRAHWRMLSPVVRWPGLTMGDVVALTGSSKQALTRIARELETAGLVTLAPGLRDRRQKMLNATAAGAALAQAIEEAMAEALGSAYAAAGQEAVSGFWHVLEGLIPVPLRMRMAEWDKGGG